MLNLGGMNSVMEELSSCVPQLIYPREVEQHANGARAVRAGVGLIYPF